MKRKAKMGALKDIADLLLPDLLEDIDKDKAKDSMPSDIKEKLEIEDDEPSEEITIEKKEERERPKMFGLSLADRVSKKEKVSRKKPKKTSR
jgi:hypothetical protein